MVSNKQTYIIDFQDARMGPITYDLVSLIWDPYVQLPEAFQQTLLAYWKKNVAHVAGNSAMTEHITLSLKDFEQEMHRMKIQRLLKAAGSYASFYNTRQRNDYLPCVSYAVNESLKSLLWLEQKKKANDEDFALSKLLNSHSFTNLEKK